jgi:hypothetical protein
MQPSRAGSAMPLETRYCTQASTSAIAAYRSGPLSALTKLRPKPDEPRTFGANTAMPRSTRDWNSGP